MLDLTAYSVERIKDPYGIIAGDRYEFLIDLEVPEDDELYAEQGVYIRVIYGVQSDRSGIVSYELRERSTDRYLAFELEEDELLELLSFCGSHYAEANG